MKRRLSRAKRKIKDAGIPFSVPAGPPAATAARSGARSRLPLFNEGYGGRVDLAAEAIRLGTALAELMPDEPEVHGLNALMLLDDARRDARFEDGELVLFAEQDRSRWDDAKITRGRETLDRALALRGEARTSCRRRSRRCTCEEPRDWSEIAGLYAELVRLTGSAVVELNRAIAVAEVNGPDAGLALVDRLDLDGYQYFHSTRADLLRRLDRAEEARDGVRTRARARPHRAGTPLPAAAPRRRWRIAPPGTRPVVTDQVAVVAAQQRRRCPCAHTTRAHPAAWRSPRHDACRARARLRGRRARPRGH